MPPGTKGAILRAVIAEKHPKMMLGQIAQRFGVTYADVRVVIDQAGYPDAPKMREAAIEYELAEHASQVAAEAIQQLEEHPEEMLGGSQGSGTYEDLEGDVQPDASEQLVNVRLAELHIDPDNVRKLPSPNDDDIVELADSITEVGLLQPIVARRETTAGDDGFHSVRLVVVMGHRRLVALQRLKWTSCKVIIRGPMLAGDVLAAMLIENGQRSDLNPMEEARGLAKLKAQLECSDLELGRRIGRSNAHVSNRLALLDLTPEEQAQVRNGTMRVTYATQRGRMNSGKLMPKGQERGWHLSELHPLAANVKARCTRLAHRGRNVGGTGCGECWEHVIRTDERRHLIDANNNDGTCPTCGTAGA